MNPFIRSTEQHLHDCTDDQGNLVVRPRHQHGPRKIEGAGVRHPWKKQSHSGRPPVNYAERNAGLEHQCAHVKMGCCSRCEDPCAPQPIVTLDTAMLSD